MYVRRSFPSPISEASWGVRSSGISLETKDIIGNPQGFVKDKHPKKEKTYRFHPCEGFEKQVSLKYKGRNPKGRVP
jgi:hypothetical protein